MEDGLHASTWDERIEGAPEPHAAVARAARLFVISGVEAGHVCPLTMTNASVAALSASPQRLAEWLPKIRSRNYDPRFIPFWEKSSVTLGMGMTEKQGGTDVRANTSRAIAVTGDEYALTGHKWFMSAPMCDAFLMLAQAPGGLTCFLLPRFRPDGSLNALRLQRLKDKLGNRSNASSEVEFEGASRGASARKAAASPPSSRWCSSRASIAPSRRPASCGWGSRSPITTRGTAASSARSSSTSRSCAACWRTSRSNRRR